MLNLYMHIDALMALSTIEQSNKTVPFRNMIVELVEMPLTGVIAVDGEYLDVTVYRRDEMSSNTVVQGKQRLHGGVEIDFESTDHGVFLVTSAGSLICRYLSRHGQLENFDGLDETIEGLEFNVVDRKLVVRKVSGKQRPDLACTTLHGELELRRPYTDEMKEQLEPEKLPLDEKIAASEPFANEQSKKEECGKTEHQDKAEQDTLRPGAKKKAERVYVSAGKKADKSPKKLKKKLKARKSALKQFERISTYRDSAERIAALKMEIAALEAETAERSALRKAKSKRAVKTIAVILLLLASFAGGVYLTYSQVLPAVKYNEAVTAIESGDYESAYYTLLDLEEYGKDLNDYKDCNVKISQAAGGYAVSMAQAGRFDEAIEMVSRYADVAEGREALAQCHHLYGVSLFEDGKLEEAIEQLEQSAELEETRPVLDNCYRGYAEQLFEQQKYAEAFAMHEKVSDYEADNDDLRGALLAQCDEVIAAEDYETALEWLELMKGYKDADEKLLQVKYQYVSAHKDRENEQTYQYLKELAEVGYEDAAEMYDEMFAWEFKITAVNIYPNNSQRTTFYFKRNSPVYIHYSVTGGGPNETMQIVAQVTLAGGSTKTENITAADGEKNYLTLVDDSRGTMTVEFFDSDGNLLAFESVPII